MKKTKSPDFDVSSWPKDSRVLSQRGYSVLKSVLTKEQDAWLRASLTVKPETLPKYDMGVEPFSVYFESKDRLYLPRDWATKLLGEPDKDTRSAGLPLREQLQFTGVLREEQKPIVNSFIGSDANGLLCVPCGYGKTFMALWLALRLKKRFLVVVHKEFLLSQWQRELETLVPGIRLGKVQGPLCQIGPEYDGALVMIQTLCGGRDYPPSTFKDFGFAVFDECHHLGAEHFSKSLLKIQCRNMLGLSATPDRSDGLTKVFTWFLGPIVHQIKHRAADDAVQVITYRYESTDPKYTHQPVDYKGEIVRARLLNQIAEFKPRTQYLTERLIEFAKMGRKILILSDRREHLSAFEAELRLGGQTDIGYYVGGMKQAALDTSEKCAIILGTFAMASEAMNIPALNTVLLATPKSNIEQSVGRILREKKEARKFPPYILDIVDVPHKGCLGQWNRRRVYYKACGYKINMIDYGKKDISDGEVEAVDQEPGAEEGPQECMIND
jgi:superfamily II DNA or RNA helicase